MAIIVITNGNYFARLILEQLIEQRSAQISGVMLVTGDYKGRTGVHAIWELCQSMAFPYFLYKCLINIIFIGIQRLQPSRQIGVEQLAKEHRIETKTVKSVKSEEAIAWVLSKKPDLVVSVSCPQLIGKRILQAPRLGGINIHSSLLPLYAGLAPYYWVLCNQEKITGTTVHYMTLKFDQGNILRQKAVPIIPGESVFNLFLRLSREGSPMLAEAVQAALDGDPGCQQDLSQSSYYSNPTYRSYIQLRKAGHPLIKASEAIRLLTGNI